MREAPHTPPRVVWWSLAAVILILICLGAGTILYENHITSEWAQVQSEREVELLGKIQQLFHDRVSSLADAARSVARESTLIADVVSNDPDRILRGYGELAAISEKTGFDLEIADPHGTPVAWSGSGSGACAVSSVDTGAAIHSSTLRSLLSFRTRNESAGLFVTAFTPFDVHGAVSERFLPARTFRQDLQRFLGREVVILGHQDAPPTDERRLRVPLADASGRVIATVLVDAPTLESELARLDAWARAWRGFFASLGAVLLGIPLYFQLLRVRMVGVRLVLIIALLWLVRFFWLLMDFPSSLVGGWIFDPSLYASLFGAGAASSLGELTLSTITVLLSILVCRRECARVDARNSFPRSVMAFAVAALATGVVLNIGVRAYGASLRSFVYDSTLRYIQPAEMIPSAPVMVMHLNILALSAALVLLFVAVMGLLFSWYRSVRPSPRPVEAFLAVGLLYSISIVVFGVFDRVPQVPWYVPYFLFGTAVAINTAVHNGLGRPLGLGLVVLSSFLVSVPVLDMKIHEKEGDRLRLYANELTQPVDAWLSFVTNESFRSVRRSYADVVSDESGKTGGTAFLLWMRTLISSEGYNSALVLYDESGKEQDRFAVGMTSYEQTELLHRLFDVDEDVLNVVERRVPSGLIKYYGLWGSIRDEHDKPIAFAALILSASEQSLFRGETPVPLRPLGTEEVGLSNQMIILSEFQDGRLVVSTDAIRQTGPDLPDEVEAAFEANQREVTVRERVEDRFFETLYVRDDTRPGRVIAISLEEVGLRWHLFNLVKVALLYAVVLGLCLVIVLMIDWRTYRGILTGFRGRLVLAFLVVAVVPLFLFAYYNREFARERQEVRMTAQLHEDLKLVSQRIVNTVTDEEDFLRGINDDFCEATASEFGVDFTVYRRDQVQASSRPELYSAGLVAQRLPGEVFAKVVVAGFGYTQTRESIGDLTYEVGYVPLMLDGRLLGVAAVPALFRQAELEAEVAERNAFTLGVYSILVILTIIVGVVLASQLSQPVRDLTKAAHAVGEGDLDVRVEREGSGELRELVRTFNEMVAELKRSREEVRRGERERAWKEMAKQVAHEIKNPLTPMRLSIQHLRTAYKDGAPGFDRLIDDVTRTLIDQIDALSRIATEFSSFARMPERRFEQIEIHELLRESIQLFTAMEGIEIRTQFADARAVLIADREELRRVIINIVRNAVQAMNQRGVITVMTSVHANRCTIDIRDTGPGIPEELQARVFEPNFSTKTDGMGLGLAMVRNVVEDLNGTVSLRSKPGAGTTISMTFPIAAG